MKWVALASALSIAQLHMAEYNAYRTLHLMGYWSKKVKCVEASFMEGEYVCLADIGNSYMILRCSGVERALCFGRVVKA